MDLSSTPFDRADELACWPGDLAALMIGVAVRQGASRTAVAQALLAAGSAERGQASFNPAVAALLAAWAAGAGAGAGADVNDAFTAAGQSIFKPACQNDEHEFKPGTGAPIEDQ